jgi:crotonobetainyl-CoA:carnitine CoA-transferase CaiB-like acyl-CoA transferase
MSGAVYRTGAKDQPYRFMVPYVDYGTAQNLTIAAMAAIIHRDKTGEGQHVEASLLLTALAVSDALLIDQQILKANHGRIGNAGLAVSPCEIFKLEDRFILVQVTGTPLFKRWCKMVGEDAWADDPRFARDDLRAAHGDILNGRMQQWCEGQNFNAAMAVLEENRIPAAEVLSPQQVLDHEHVKAMGYLKPVDYPGLPEPAPLIQTPFEMSATPGRIAMRAPTLGEHNAEVYGEIGYDATAIGGLKERGVI